MLYAEIIGLVQLWPWPGLGGTRPWLCVEFKGLNWPWNSKTRKVPATV